MYSYGPYVPAPALRTPKGLGNCVIAFVLYLCGLAITTIIAAIAFSILSSGSGNPLGQFFFLGILGITAGILILIAFCFYIAGFNQLYQGRSEFGPSHARNLQLSLYLLIAAIVVGAVGPIVQFFLALSSFSFGPGGPSFDPQALYLSLIIGVVFGIVTAALVAALLVLSIRALAHPDHQRFLQVAAAIGTATPGIAGAIAIVQLPQLLSGFGSASFDLSMGIPSLLASLLGILTFIIFLFVYRTAARRIQTGELSPTLPPPTAVPWMPSPWVPPAAPPGPPPPSAPPAP